MKLLLTCITGVLLSSAACASDELSFQVEPGVRSGSRVRWSVPFVADLSACDGFEFDFRCSELQSFKAYIHVGDGGCYTAKFPLSAVGEWTHVTLRKQSVYNTEKSPQGWADVRSFQIVCTPNGTNGFSGAVRNVRPLPSLSPSAALLYVERSLGDKSAKTEFPVDKKSKALLSRADIDSFFLSDRDLVRKGVPPNVKMLFITSASRAISDDVVEPLRDLLRNGGKIACVGGKCEVCRAFAREFPAQVVDARRLRAKGAAAEKELARFVQENMGEFAEAIERNAARRAEIERQHAREIAAIPSIPGECRPMLCHTPWGSKGACTNWESAARLVKESGFTTLCACFCRGIYAAYDSKVLKPWPGMATAGDGLEQCKAACRKYGLSIAAWRCCWITPGWLVAKEDLAAKRAAGRMPVDSKGVEDPNSGCPTHPVNIREEVESLVELASKGVDWVVLDYIRYRNENLCFCARCRNLFEKEIGRRIDNWPKAVLKGGNLFEKWIDFRAGNISHVVKAAGERIHRDHPGVKIFVCGFTNPESARKAVGQDWDNWCRQGWIDGVLMMDYCTEAVEFDALIRRQKKLDVGNAVLYPLIGTSCWPDIGEDALQTARQIQAARTAGYSGWGIFALDLRTERICPVLATGPTAGAAMSVSICDFGAVGGGTTNTVAIQRAIDDRAAAGGGVVIVPPGRFLTGSVCLKSGVELRIEDGGVLEGVAGIENYSDISVGYSEMTYRQEFRGRMDSAGCESIPWHALVYAVDATNVAVTGKGVMFGNGWNFPWRCHGNRPQGVLFCRCRDVRLEGVQIRDPARWSCYFKECDGVVVRGVRIDAHSNCNNDGFDIESRNVLIEDCDIDAGDDAIVLKSDNPQYCVENVEVRNCRLASNCNHFKIGTATHGSVRHVRVRGCTTPQEEMAWLPQRPDRPDRNRDTERGRWACGGCGGERHDNRGRESADCDSHGRETPPTLRNTVWRLACHARLAHKERQGICADGHGLLDHGG